MLTSATGFDPNFADAWGRLAQACIQMGVVFDSDPGWLAKAEAAVAKALALDMAHADAFCARGQLLWTPTHAFQNRPALRALNSALKLNPGCHQAQIWRGLIFFHVGLYAEARQGLEEALAVHPEDTRTMVFLAQTALYRGDYEEAYELVREAYALEAERSASGFGSGEVFGRRTEFFDEKIEDAWKESPLPRRFKWKLQSEYSLRGITPRRRSGSYGSGVCQKSPWFS
jgi:tetratricopeptide (TPR) repeat protein